MDVLDNPMLGDNTYTVRVYADLMDDGSASPLLRALHAELCRLGSTHGDHLSVCARAAAVFFRWEADGRPEHNDGSTDG